MSETSTQKYPRTVRGQAQRAVDMLDALDTSDPEMAHGAADDIVLAVARPEVREAYQRVVDRTRWWATA